MSEDDLPMMPFFVKDWLAATMHWPDAERGAYVSLLCFQWANGYVPSDAHQLARIMGTPDDRFEAVWSIVGRKFDSDERGLFNIRLEEHRKESLRLRASRTLGASLSNQKRRAERDARRDAQHIAERDAERHAQATHTSTSTSTSTEEEPKTERKEEGRVREGGREGNFDLTLSATPSVIAPRALGKPHQRFSAKRAEKLDERFIELKATYPLRNGAQPWKLALGCWHARIAEGYTPEQIIEGTERYAVWCRNSGKERTERVMQAKTFLGPEKHFLADWDLLPEAANDERWSPESEEIQEPPDGYAA